MSKKIIRKTKKTIRTGAALKVGGVAVVATIVGGGAYLLYTQFKDFKLKFPNLGLGDFLGGIFGKVPTPLPPAVAFVKPTTAITLENIQSIAQDESISVSERITVLQMILTEELANKDMEYSEIAILESRILELETEEQVAEAQISYLDADIKAETEDVEFQKRREATRYRRLMEAQDAYDVIADKGFLADPIKLMDAANYVRERQRKYDNNVQARKSEEEQLNKALSAKSAYMESTVNPIREQLLADRQSLNTWIIAYSAAENLINGLETTITELEGL